MCWAADRCAAHVHAHTHTHTAQHVCTGLMHLTTLDSRLLAVLLGLLAVLLGLLAASSPTSSSPDGSGEYLRKLLEPELTKLPDLMELPEFIKSRPAGKFPAMDYAYLMASRYDEATELLIPLCEVGPLAVATCLVVSVQCAVLVQIADLGPACQCGCHVAMLMPSCWQCPHGTQPVACLLLQSRASCRNCRLDNVAHTNRSGGPAALPHIASFPLLLPHPQAPRAQVLAKQVTNVLDGKMRDVSDEGELHVFVDSLFEEMFDLASDHGLLIYQSKRGPTDTTGQCKL